MHPTYEQQELIKRLKHYINTFTADRYQPFVELKAKEADIEWHTSLFLAKAIHLSLPFKYECSIEDFQKFKDSYVLQKKREVNAEPLFQKFWLRKILGFVEIAGAVSSACSTFDELAGFKNELKFICQFYEEEVKEKKTIQKDVLENAIKSYEKTHNISLKYEGVYFNRWMSEKDGQIELSNINFYFKPFLDYWDDFEFLAAFRANRRTDKKGLFIERDRFENLHQSFTSFYPKTPSIQKLIEEKLISSDENFYYLNFYNTEIRYWSELSDKISGYYWEMLIDDVQFNSDEERIKRFLEQTFYWNGFPNLLEHVIEALKKKFLDAAFQLVLNDTDIVGTNGEFQKVSIDGSYSSNETYHLFHNKEEHNDFFLNDTDCFELLESLDNWEKKARTTYLHDQKSRAKLAYLIKIIVKYDSEIERVETTDEDNPEIFYYRRTLSLLKNSLDKPALLWDTTRFIIMCRREIIPYLLINKEFTSLAFQMIDDFEFPENERNELSQKLWIKSVGLALSTIRSVVQEENLSAKLISQIYRQLNSQKYDIPYNRPSKKIETLTRKQKEEKEQIILTAIENCLLHNHKIYGGREQYLLPFLFNDLLTLFVDLKIKPLYNNGTIQFPMLQWDGLTWLMKCSTYWKYKFQFETHPANTHLLTSSFFNLYMERIEVTNIKKYNFFEKKEDVGLPLWSEKIERLEYIDWIYPIYFLFKQQKLSSFLEPRFSFKPTKDHYHKENQFTADKLRTHIGVLIQVLRKLILPSIPYSFDKTELLQIKSRVEQQIIDYLKVHIKDVPEEGRIDLFDYNKEWGFNSSEKEALLPQISRALNWFDKKEDIVETIIQSQNIIKILTITEWITSEGIKKKLIEKINEADLKTFFETTHWIPEVQQALLKMSHYPELIKQTNEIINFWKENISKKNREYENQLYQTQMLLSYFDKNEIELNKIQEPQKNTVHRVNELSYSDHKDFYRALIRMGDAPQSAYKIFDRLSYQYPHYPVLALNRMAAKINMAKISNDNKLYREALEEWKAYENRQNELDTDSLGNTFIANKLYILLKLNEFEELDNSFNKLELPFQMLPDILEIKIESLDIRNKKGEALALLKTAEDYHFFSGIENIGFLKDLRSKVNGDNNVYELQYQYTRIFNNSPSVLIQIFPPKLNGKTDLFDFITKEVAIAASKMLDKINALPDILKLKNTSKENRFSDLLQLALEARISPWGWSVKDQTRKAFSPADKDLGEIDLDIRDCNQESFITCEAFILREPSKVKSHLEKLISDYTHKRKAFLVITYFTGKQADFQSEWSNYYQNTLASLKYPIGFELDSNHVTDVTSEFGCDHTGIKIGKAILKSGSILFNVFININYQVK